MTPLSKTLYEVLATEPDFPEATTFTGSLPNEAYPSRLRGNQTAVVLADLAYEALDTKDGVAGFFAVTAIRVYGTSRTGAANERTARVVNLVTAKRYGLESWTPSQLDPESGHYYAEVHVRAFVQNNSTPITSAT